MLHGTENQFFMLDFPSEMPLFRASEGFLKGFCSRIPTEKCDFGIGDEKKFRLANSHCKVIKIFWKDFRYFKNFLHLGLII